VKRLLAFALVTAACFAVRTTDADAPPCRYVIPGNGTVLDTKTKLTWEQVEGAPSGPVTWPTAMAFCASLKLAGLEGWRLPTIKELFTLVDPSVDMATASFAIDRSAFAYTYANVYWSSTLAPGSPQTAWALRYDGTNYPFDTQSSDSFGVRCVR
jgi:hypothetical protein